MIVRDDNPIRREHRVIGLVYSDEAPPPPRPRPLSLCELRPRSFNSYSCTKSLVGKIIPERGGVTVRVGALVTKLTVPAIRSRAHCVEIMAALLNAFDVTPQESDWVIDISQIAIAPAMLLGSLLAYQRHFERRGRTVELLISPRCELSRSFTDQLGGNFKISVKTRRPARIAPQVLRPH